MLDLLLRFAFLPSFGVGGVVERGGGGGVDSFLSFRGEFVFCFSSSVLGGDTETGRGDFLGGRFFRFASGVDGDLGSGEKSSPDIFSSIICLASHSSLLEQATVAMKGGIKGFVRYDLTMLNIKCLIPSVMHRHNQ